MKWLLIFWGGPVLFLTSWFTLSYYDMSFGMFILSRDAHDFVFEMYGNLLGIDPQSIPYLVGRAMVFDSFLVFGLLAVRKRHAILAWYRGRNARPKPGPQPKPGPEAAALSRDANLSSAP
jgi:hypothetical protein